MAEDIIIAQNIKINLKKTQYHQNGYPKRTNYTTVKFHPDSDIELLTLIFQENLFYDWKAIFRIDGNRIYFNWG